jgi:curved DNA-binding protein CbpA
MATNGFVDYYELLQLSSSADTETIDRVFRHFARKYHPDNKDSGNTDLFRLIVDAHKTLSDPESRAGYDVKYCEHREHKWNVASEASNWSCSEPSNGRDFSEDRKNRENLLSILYVQRRHDMKKPGLGDIDLAHLLSIPLELIEFHLWYLKAKGWIERLDSGQLAITALGVDEVEGNQSQLRNDHMLTAGRFLPDES